MTMAARRDVVHFLFFQRFPPRNVEDKGAMPFGKVHPISGCVDARKPIEKRPRPAVYPRCVKSDLAVFRLAPEKGQHSFPVKEAFNKAARDLLMGDNVPIELAKNVAFQ